MTQKETLQRVLIANRGVIAQRIARSCHELGLEVFMIYAPNDRHLPWLQMADQIFCCDYTDRERLISLAKTHGAAIHPGYGFLSEDATFAAQCKGEGILWMGPAHQVLALTGHKQKCVAHLKEHGVRCLPHLALPASESAHISQEKAHLWTETNGFPCMVKPSAGGGGQGMVWVENPSQLSEALMQARNLGEDAYGCGDLLLEKALLQARHIEVQLVADTQGQYCIVGDRDCSLQRRRQKVLEEGPSTLNHSERDTLYATATHIAQCLGINQVSTLEFLWDGETFWFLEANPRLQVEHAVSEALTGLDLVACQLASAQGIALDQILAQQHIPLPLQSQGHAIEARIYAESPETLLPTTGRILELSLPTGHGLRIENCIYRGMEISPHYDGLLMKIIAHGPTREHSRRRLQQALRQLVIQGDSTLRTNQASLLHLVEHPDFITGTYHTRSGHALMQRPHGLDSLSENTALQTVKKALIKAFPQQKQDLSHRGDPGVQAYRDYQDWRPSHW